MISRCKISLLSIILLIQCIVLAYGSETPTNTPVIITEPTYTPTPAKIRPTPTPYSKDKRFIRSYTQESQSIENAPKIIYGIAFSPDGKSIFTSDNKQQLIRWALETGTIEKIYKYEAQYILSMRLSSDGTKILQGFENFGFYFTALWDVLSGKTLSTLKWSYDITACQLFDNGNKCFLGTRNSGYFIWDYQKRQVVFTQNFGNDYSIIHFALSPNEKLCTIVAEQDVFGKGNQVVVLDMKTLKILRKISLSSQKIFNCQWLENGKHVWFESFTQTGDSLYKGFLDLFDIESGSHLSHLEKSPLWGNVTFTRKGDKFVGYAEKSARVFTTFTGDILAEFPHSENLLSAIFSPDEKKVLTGTSTADSIAGAYLWDISDLGDYPIPTFVPYTPTPTPTYTPTQTPDMPSSVNANYEIHPVKHNLVIDTDNITHIGAYAINPDTNEIIYVVSTLDKGDGNYLKIYKYPSPQKSGFLQPDLPPCIMIKEPYCSWINHVTVCQNGTIVIIKDSRKIQFVYPNGTDNTILITDDSRTFSTMEVKSSNCIPGTKPGDILVHRKLLSGIFISGDEIDKIDPLDLSKGLIPLLGNSDIPESLHVADISDGPGGYLYVFLSESGGSAEILSNGLAKIFYIDENQKLKEWSHFNLFPLSRLMQSGFAFITFSHEEGVFYLTAPNYNNANQEEIFQIADRYQPPQLIALSKSFIPFLNSSNNRIFLSTQSENNSTTFSELNVIKFKTPTPTPSTPSPTPTHIPGWFVLDGLGGIHGTNPNFKIPVLPYWWNFNIARDIEPDPLGRGWYMLDGFGGIHTSSPDLPKPDSLPYFGFDIARNLKVKEVNGKLEFYLLDGYGMIHTTDHNFNQGNLPGFGDDFARCLRFDPNSSVMMEMDVYGTIYRSDNTLTDDIRFAPVYGNSPVMRSFVRFPDDTTVMLDLFGGRHTNPFYPAKDVVNGLPADFYFPGWDIIWDLELVPENWAKRRK